MSAETPSHAAVDRENPWLGLASFTEETRAYFHGRDDDVAELARRVQRKSLTILFGQSGHGKTSLLRAGLVPRLRPEGYCPVYVRLDYSPGSPSPAEQIKAAIFHETLAAGHWTQTGSSVAGESLWEFLHHRDDVLKDAGGRALTPLLIFDQFEEIFTLAQADDAGRQRAQTFLNELADLVENRAPAELEAKIDRDEVDASKFDFARADYRILLSLREDYLAHLEALKNVMPSVTQNRVRLARFTGAQALAAVRDPAPQLVEESVAAQIVRFVSGGTDLARAEVEPSLLSLVCRELNNARLARGQATITADLLAGSRDTILSEFYERALADQPPGVRRFVEDELLTDSGFRESVAEERVRKTFAAAGAAPDALATLIARRLLRVEERLDVRRVELTHDVLSGIVSASRSVRREREAKEAAEQQLAATREKEAAAQRALWRARRVATFCAVLAVAAVGSAVFGYFTYRRARVAEKEALRAAAEARVASEHMQATKETAQEARAEAEKIVSFLLDDFYRELEPIGRLRVVRGLAERAVAYYRALPPELRSPETVRNQALALTRLGAVLVAQGALDDARAMLDESIRTFRGLKANGDNSVELNVGLSLALRNISRLEYADGRRDAALASGKEAVENLRPFASQPGAARATQMEWAEDFNRYGFEQLRLFKTEEALATCSQAIAIFEKLGAKTGEKSDVSAAYADCSIWVVEAATTLNRIDQAHAVARDSLAIAEKVLARDPGNVRALRAHGLLLSLETTTYQAGMQQQKALEAARQADDDNRKLYDLDPSNVVTHLNYNISTGTVNSILMETGHISEGMARMSKLVERFPPETLTQAAFEDTTFGVRNYAQIASAMGSKEHLDHALDNFHRLIRREHQLQPKDSSTTQAYDAAALDVESYRAEFAGDYESVARQTAESARRLREIRTGNSTERLTRIVLLANSVGHLCDAQIHLHNGAAAEASARELLSLFLELPAKNDSDRRGMMSGQAALALALTLQNRNDEALKEIQPVVEFERRLAGMSGDDPVQRTELAVALYINARALPAGAAQRLALLDESAKILDGVPQELRDLRPNRELAQWIADAR